MRSVAFTLQQVVVGDEPRVVFAADVHGLDHALIPVFVDQLHVVFVTGNAGDGELSAVLDDLAGW